MAIDFDLLDPTILSERRFPAYAKLREDAPVLGLNLNGIDTHLITRFADVDRVMRDPRVRVRPSGGGIPKHLGDGPAADFYRYSLPCLDAPDHVRMRNLVSPAFGSNVVDGMYPWIGEIVDRHLDDLAGRESVDFAKEFATAVPAEIAFRFLHVPLEDADELLSRQMPLIMVLGQGELSPEALEGADEAAAFYFDYFGKLVDSLRGTLPEDDVVGALLAAAEGGDRLSRIELLVTLVDLVLASYHTTKVSLTSAVWALLSHPDEFRRLQADIGLAASAWEESLRFDSPIHAIWRELPEPMELSGTTVSGHVVLGLAAASRDERQFTAAEKFDITRDEGRHMAFASGPHYCIGAPLSRLEGEIFLSRFARRFPKAELAGPEPKRFPDLTFAFIEELPISPGAAAS